MLLVSKRPDVSVEEFRRHYEEIHAPLAAKHLPHLAKYVRNHVVDRFGPDVDCHVITEFWYDLEGPWRDKRVELLRQDLLDLFAKDEETFMDRATMRVLVVEEGETPAGDLSAGARRPS